MQWPNEVIWGSLCTEGFIGLDNNTNACVTEVAVGDERVAYAWALHLVHEAKRIIALSLRPL
jgi:hypothetical protein